MMKRKAELKDNFGICMTSIVAMIPKQQIQMLHVLLCFMDRNYVNRCELSNIDPADSKHHLINEQLYLGIAVASKINTSEIKAGVSAGGPKLFLEYKAFSRLKNDPK
ncbi:unnamed protein product [Parnassius apollo]|uniref:(apollo) hypothetical protein n=1 Tax=Parnassius apollo TaxID=110799 RepID=A0A8S3WZ11_PARAO|nr:unnamed protein product [Parnassius apollo]